MTESISLKEHLESEVDTLNKIVDERDRLYDTRFKASEVAVNAALAAQEKAVTSAFSASEKAIVKAEEAQKAYNLSHNDLSRKMDDQYKLMMPRPETLGLFSGVADRFDALQKQVDDLRLSKATLEGKASQASVTVAFIFGVIGIVMSIIGIALKFI